MFTSVWPGSGPAGGNIDEKVAGRRTSIDNPLAAKSSPLLLTSRLTLAASSKGAMHLMRVEDSIVAGTTFGPNLQESDAKPRKPVPEIATDVPPSRNTDRGTTCEIVIKAGTIAAEMLVRVSYNLRTGEATLGGGVYVARGMDAENLACKMVGGGKGRRRIRRVGTKPLKANGADDVEKSTPLLAMRTSTWEPAGMAIERHSTT
jgi:hypothetical protein